MKLFKKIKDITILGSGDILGSGLSAIFWFYLASQIEPENYGEIHWFLGIAGIFSAISLFSTVNTITVYTAKKIQINSTLNLISLLSSVLFSFIVIAIFPSFYSIDIGIILIAYVINHLAIGDLLGKKEFSSHSKYTLVQKGSTLALGVLLFHIFGYEAIIFALACSYIFYIKRVYSVFKEMKINFDLIKQRKEFILNNYFTFLLTGAVGGGQIDKIIVAPLLGFAILGNYNLALQIINLMMIIPTIFYKYLLPHESTGIKNKQIKIIVIVFSILISILGIFIAPILIEEFFPKFSDAINAIKIMSIVIIPSTLSLILESEFLGKEKSRIVIIGSSIFVSSQVISMIILGSLYGIDGVAYSLVIAVTLKTCLYLFSKNKQF